jgi:hypothetical protein
LTEDWDREACRSMAKSVSVSKEKATERICEMKVRRTRRSFGHKYFEVNEVDLLSSLPDGGGLLLKVKAVTSLVLCSFDLCSCPAYGGWLSLKVNIHHEIEAE